MCNSFHLILSLSDILMEGFFVLGDRIKLIREANKLNQVEFGKILNVTKQTVSNWENNNIQPSIEMVKKIALKFGVSSDYILELEDIRAHAIFLNKGLPIDKVAHIQFLIKDMEELYSKSEEK